MVLICLQDSRTWPISASLCCCAGADVGSLQVRNPMPAALACLWGGGHRGHLGLVDMGRVCTHQLVSPLLAQP